MTDADYIERQLNACARVIHHETPIRLLLTGAVIQCAVLIARGLAHDPHAQLAIFRDDYPSRQRER